MKRKFIIAIASAGAAVALLPLFAAFEAHVVNVTAKIENALGVSTDAIDFGTVFPQEHLAEPLRVALSQSFMDEERVDDVEYFIRQKPKCAATTDGGTTLLEGIPTATGHLVLDEATGEVDIDCGPAPDNLPQGAAWGVLPSLCEYISKEDDETPDNDGSLASFHQPWAVIGDGTNTPFSIAWNDTPGRLAKSEQDTEDNWIIDLAVPCFGGFCAQDWAEFVAAINPSANPDDYTQPIANEHKIFGCDLWVEVSGVSCTATEEAGTVVSDTTNTVVENANAPAEALTFIHPAWTASIPGATWIWENDPVQNPTLTETFTFRKQFTIVGTVTSASIDIAADNLYRIRVNNVLVGEEQVTENNFQAGTQDSYPVTSLVTGLNTIEIELTNVAMPGGTPESNPAGLLYKLAYESSVCTE